MTDKKKGKCFSCGGSSDYKIGAAASRWKKKWFVVGESCEQHVPNALERLSGLCFGLDLWPVVAWKTGKIIYHSYKASQEGLSIMAGWRAHKDSNE